MMRNKEKRKQKKKREDSKRGEKILKGSDDCGEQSELPDF
jgi:hypothetical protein